MPTRFRIRTSLVATVAAVAAVAVPVFAASSASATSGPRQAQQTQHAQPASAAITVTGAVQHPLRLTDAKLAALPATTVPTIYQTSKGYEAHIFRGPKLFDIIQQAKPALKPGAHNDQLRFVVLATGADGYGAALSLSEIDPDFGGTRAIIARYVDGQKLTEPRIVVPGDVKGGRYVSELVSLKVSRLG